MSSNSDLMQMLKELQIYNSIDNFFNPDHTQLMIIYEKFCDLINCDENFTIENNMLSLFYRCKIMCRTVGIMDFQMADLIDPEPKRMKNILAQLSKYCYWSQEQSQKWEKKIKEITNLEDIEQAEIKKQKNELENIISMKNKDLELRKKRFEQIKLMKNKLEQDIQQKKTIKQKLIQSITQNQNELQEASKKYNNLQEKQKVAQNELTILETMIVRDPKLLEQKMLDSQRRMESLQLEVEKCQKELRLEEFKIEKIYKILLQEYDSIVKMLQLAQNSQEQLQDLEKQQERLNETLLFLNNKTLQEEKVLDKLNSDKEILQQQKAQQQEKDSTSHQYSLQSLIELQNQIQELQQQYKTDQIKYTQIQGIKQDFIQQLQEADKTKQNIEENLKQVVNQQLLEVNQYTKNIESLINKIEFE